MAAVRESGKPVIVLGFHCVSGIKMIAAYACPARAIALKRLNFSADRVSRRRHPTTAIRARPECRVTLR